MRCEYREIVNGLWQCSACGDARTKPVRRECGAEPISTIEPSEITEVAPCPHRQLAHRLAGKPYGVCSAVEIHSCGRFSELVQIRRHGDQDKLKVDCPAFRGRYCVKCDSMVDVADILHVTPKPNWQDFVRRAGHALRQHGLTLRLRECVRPADLDAEISRSHPRLVLIHAFAVPAADVLRVADRWQTVQFAIVSHSQENHLFTWPQFCGEIRRVLESPLPNVHFASSTAADWQSLGRDVLQWEWPCVLPEWREPANVPPTVLITSRADLVKCLPAQILAAGILQRQVAGLRVAVAVNGSDQRTAGLRDLAAASGLQVEWWPWLEPDAFLRRLRDEVSVVLQPSWSETFNYVSWEAAAVGRPFVGSAAIPHCPADWRADPNSPADIARAAGEIIADYPAQSRQARLIAEQVAAANNAAYARLVAGQLLAGQ